MKIRMKVVVVVVVCVVLVGVMVQQVIQMGVVLLLIGVNVIVGEDVWCVVDLVVDKVNSQGGVLGKKFLVIVEDFGGNLIIVLNVVCKLVLVDKVLVVIGEYFFGISIFLGQYLVKEGVVYINIVSISVKICDIGVIFFNLIGLENFGNCFLVVDIWVLGYCKVVVIVFNNVYGQGVVYGFKQEFEKLGGQVVIEVFYIVGQFIYCCELQQIVCSVLDVYVYMVYGQELVIFNCEVFELGLCKILWYGILLLMCLFDILVEIVNGQFGMEVGLVDGLVGCVYVDVFSVCYKEGMKIFYIGYVYDVVLMMVVVINKVKLVELVEVVVVLKEIGKNYVGVIGMISFDVDCQCQDLLYVKFKYQGKVVLC